MSIFTRWSLVQPGPHAALLGSPPPGLRMVCSQGRPGHPAVARELRLEALQQDARGLRRDTLGLRGGAGNARPTGKAGREHHGRNEGMNPPESGVAYASSREMGRRRRNDQ